MTRQSSAGERTARAAAYENARPEIQRQVPPGARRILDLGCSSGAVGDALKSRGEVEIVGVERDSGYAKVAERRLDRVITADLEELATREGLAEELGRFDCLIAGDVLEHLRDPWTCLRRFAGLLRPGGTAIVSLPNIRYWETFWLLGVRGVWPRRLEGIFDRDHLRWFTIATAMDLVDQASLDAVEIDRQYRLSARGSQWDHHVRKLARTPLRPFFTFQFVIVARRR